MAYYSANEAIEALKKLKESGNPITQEAVEAIVNNVSVVDMSVGLLQLSSFNYNF